MLTDQNMFLQKPGLKKLFITFFLLGNEMQNKRNYSSAPLQS